MGTAVAILGTAVALGTVVAVRSGEALPGTTVAGVDVSGLGPDHIASALGETVEARTTGTLQAELGGETVSLDRGTLTGDVDLEATAEAALKAGRSDYALASVLGPLLPLGERSVELEVPVDRPAVEQRLAALAAGLDGEPSPGGFTVDGTTVSAVPPEPGLVLDEPVARRRVEAVLLTGEAGPVELPVETIAPPTSLADVERVTGEARRALSHDRYRLEGAGAAVEVTTDRLVPLLDARLVEGELRLYIDRAGLYGLVFPQAQQVDRPPRSAVIDVPDRAPRFDDQGSTTWTPRPAEVTVVPGAPGRDVPETAATDQLADLILAGQPIGPLPVETTVPPFSTADAEAAGVRRLIGTFTTYYTAGQPRARNIARMADLVNGTYLPPGASFSLNETAGRRTTARGFEADGAIIDGELVDVVGGGVSQFATTTFNAAFFAGLPILEHRPHSFYISRYPAGRESTLNWGTIDVRFRNDTGNGIVIAAGTTASSVTVSFYGDNGDRQVRAVHGPREPREGGGFRTEVTRLIDQGESGRRVFRTSYGPPPD